MSQISKTTDWIYEIGFAFFAILFFAFWPNIMKGFSAQENMLWKDPLYFILIPTLIYFCAVSRLAARILGSKILSFMGNISYSVYLLHQPVLFYIKRNLTGIDNTLQYFVVSMVVITLVGALSYYFIERLARKYINGLFRGDRLGKPVEQKT